jgi:hypothetical protein
MKLRGLVQIGASVIGLLLISCGGSGGGGTNSFSATTRSVQGIQMTSALSMAKSGIAMAPFFFGGFGGGSGTTGSSTGGGGGAGGGGITSIGFFFRDFGGPSGFGSMMSHRMRGATRDGGTTGSGGGDGGSDDFYFDEWLQLWAEVQWTDNTFAIHFYQDEAKTLPAGHTTSTFTGSLDAFPQTYSYDYEFTAGTWAGSHGSYICSSTSETVGSMIYENAYSDGSHDEGHSDWDESASSWHSRWDGPNSQGWFEDSGTWNLDGSGIYTCSDFDGWASTWSYNADWSGSAHFTGPDPKLPADMTWTADGHYKITYADGSKEEWSWSDLWDSEEGGTTGTAGFAPNLARSRS